MTTHYKRFLQLKKMLTAIILLMVAMPAMAQWSLKAPLPGAGRDAPVAFTINNKVYLAGGNANKDFWRYDPAANTWTRLADIPGTIANRGFAVGFVLNGKGYVGTGADTSIYTVENDLWQYDTTTNTWTQMASLPGDARDGAFSFVINNIAYVGGGNNTSGYLLNDFWAYDPVANSWTAKATLPDYMLFPFAFSIGNYGYISCGQQGAAESTLTWQYNPATNAWVSKAAFPGTARQAGAAFVIDSTAYCGMGMIGYTTAYQDIYKYNATTNSWTLLGNFPGGTDAWPVAAVANHKAYVGTGWNFTTFANYWYQYTPPSTSIALMQGHEKEISVFPNPGSGVINIYIPNKIAGDKYTYSICDIMGRQLSSGALGETIDVNNVPAGNYLLRVANDNEIITKMIVVK